MMASVASIPAIDGKCAQMKGYAKLASECLKEKFVGNCLK
jgi:hypothetical protein